MQNSIVNVNGQILGPEVAKVSVFDRGFLYGDSLYEVVRSYRGEFFLLDEHLHRLTQSAALCKMKLGQTIELYKNEIERTFQSFQENLKNFKQDAYARIIISRGTSKIGFGLSNLVTPTQYIIIMQPVDAPSSEVYSKGMKLEVAQRLRLDPRALDPAMKSGNYLNSLLAYLEAEKAGYDDALLCNSDGHITEGTTFNVFYARRGILTTPPLGIGILSGITRSVVIQIAKELKIPFRETRFPRERLYEADEVFVTGSVKEIVPVTQIDRKVILKGKPGPITQKLHQAYRNRIEAASQGGRS